MIGRVIQRNSKYTIARNSHVNFPRLSPSKYFLDSVSLCGTSKGQWAKILDSEERGTRLSFHTTTAVCNQEFDYPRNVYLDALQETLEIIEKVMEPVIDGIDDQEYECEVSDGVMQIKFGENGTFVISRQTPSRQLWLSSPVSGPWHYQYDDKTNDWICTKKDMKFWERIEKEFSEILGMSVRFDAHYKSSKQ